MVVVAEHGNIGLDDIDIVRESKHRLLIGLAAALPLQANFVQLRDVTICYYLVGQRRKFLCVECHQLDVIAQRPLVLYVVFCFLEVGGPLFHQTNVLLYLRLVPEALVIKLLHYFALFCV